MWITNYLLVYALSPETARMMPAYWAPIPEEVASALRDSANGQVAYADYMEYFTD